MIATLMLNLYGSERTEDQRRSTEPSAGLAQPAVAPFP